MCVKVEVAAQVSPVPNSPHGHSGRTHKATLNLNGGELMLNVLRCHETY